VVFRVATEVNGDEKSAVEAPDQGQQDKGKIISAPLFCLL